MNYPTLVLYEGAEKGMYLEVWSEALDISRGVLDREAELDIGCRKGLERHERLEL